MVHLREMERPRRTIPSKRKMAGSSGRAGLFRYTGKCQRGASSRHDPDHGRYGQYLGGVFIHAIQGSQ